MNSSRPVDVIVIGAGYAGVIATNRLLGSLTDGEAGRLRLTVVNPQPDFVERIRAAAPIPGAREHAFLLGDIEGASAAADAIARERGQRVLVIGGGLTGVEASSEIAEKHPDAQVTLVSAGRVVGFMRAAARRSILRTLDRLGVTVEAPATVRAIERDRALLQNGQEIAFDVCVLAASFIAPDLARASGLTVDDAGRLGVDEHLRAIDAPEIVGAGDAVVVPDALGSHLRMSCAAALPLDAHAAATLLAALRNRKPTRLSVGFVLQCISLGRRSGYVQVVQSDDTPRPLHMSGRFAARIKEHINTMVLQALSKERTRPGTSTTIRGPKVLAPGTLNAISSRSGRRHARRRRGGVAPGLSCWARLDAGSSRSCCGWSGAGVCGYHAPA